MKKSNYAASAVLFAIFLTACSPVKFYSDRQLTKKSGLKFYTAKPFLKVERELNNNNVVKAEVIYLPDLSEPIYIAVKNGPGSRKVDIKLTDGTISTLGIATDPKIAESIESLADLISETTGAITDLSALKGYVPGSLPVTNTELYEVLITSEGTSLRKVEFNNQK